MTEASFSIAAKDREALLLRGEARVSLETGQSARATRQAPCILNRKSG